MIAPVILNSKSPLMQILMPAMEKTFLQLNIFMVYSLVVITAPTAFAQATIGSEYCDGDNIFFQTLQAEIENLRNVMSRLVQTASEQAEELKALKNQSRTLPEDHEQSQETVTDRQLIQGLGRNLANQWETILNLNRTNENRYLELTRKHQALKEELVLVREDGKTLRVKLNETAQELKSVREHSLLLRYLNSSLQVQLDEQKLQLSEQQETIRRVLNNDREREEQLKSLAQLNNTSMETGARQREIKLALGELNVTMRAELAVLRQENSVREERFKEMNSSLRQELGELRQKNGDISQRLHQVEQVSNATRQSQNTGVSYLRWGRKVCPQNSSSIYTGYAATSHYNEKGGGNDYLCLPDRPQWNTTIAGVQGIGSSIHGVEYELTQSNSPFSTANNGGLPLTDKNAPCSLCRATGRTQQVMFPARTECPAGWTLLYRGYLVSSHKSHHKMGYVCLDEAPESVPASHRNEDGGLFYPVEVACGSLSCPNYVSGYELACVVCAS